LANWAFIGLSIVTAICAVTSLALPFGWDHGIMASVGSSYIHGGLPYADSWDMKGPISYLPYTLAEEFFGPTMWGVRIFDVIIAAVASFIFYKRIGALTDWRVGAWAAFALYYWIAATGWFYTAAPESWAGALCVMAIVPLLTADKAPGNSRLALTGVLVGCLGLIKPLYLAVGIAPLLSILLAQGLTHWRRVGLALVLAAGAVAPIFLMGGYFLWRGDLSQAIEVHILYPLSSYALIRTNGTTVVQGCADFFARPTVALLASFVALGIWDSRKQPQILWPALGWLAAIVFAVIAQGKYFAAHWMPAYAPLLFLAALGVNALARVEVKGRSPQIIALGVVLMFTALVCAPPLYDASKAIYYFGIKRSPERYYASFHFYIYNAEDEQEAARYIDEHTKSSDGIFVWGNDATVPYLANRPNPSRFTFEMPLSLPGSYLERYRDEAMRELRANPPAYFVVGINWWGADTKEQSLAKFPDMAAFLSQGYSLEKSFGVLDLYRRKTADETHTSSVEPFSARSPSARAPRHTG
jgi:hypothetical protein